MLSLFWCGCCAFSWGACSFPQRVLQLATLLGFRTLLTQVGWPTPAVGIFCGVGGILVHLLVFYLVPAQLPLPLLPLSGFCTLSGSSLLVYSCGGALLLGWRCLVTPLGFLPCASATPPSAAYLSRGCGNLSGSSLLVYYYGGTLLLGWGCLCCVAWFSTMCRAHPPGPAACAAFPAAGSLGNFQVTGCLYFCFLGDVGWASALPFFFCASPAPTGLQGLAGFCTLCQGAPVGMVSALG